ncbi:MAG: hypothetical protein VXZ82_19875 [Planctomycetota bacterium]|nr:hypothetical protein [Planctomycetota bacterium]
MGKLSEGIKTINTTVRTIILAALVGVIGVGGWQVYSEYTKKERMLADQEEQLTTLKGQIETKDAAIEKLGTDLKEKTEQVEELSQQVDRLETAMILLKTDQRLARLEVIDIKRDEEGKALESNLRFVELSPNGDALSEPKEVTLPGDLVYVDNWIIKFDDEYIQKGDIQRGTSLCLFRRIFSEDQQPAEGFSLDEVGMRPQAYSRGGVTSEFEEKLWKEFWEFANDEQKAAEMGIRAAHGEAVAIKVKEGKQYNIELRASGGLSFKPVAKPAGSNEDAL